MKSQFISSWFHLVYFLARKYRKRAILKNGECNIVQSKLSQKRLRYLQDAFTTFVDTQVSFIFADHCFLPTKNKKNQKLNEWEEDSERLCY